MSMLHITCAGMLRRRRWTLLLVGVVLFMTGAAAVLCTLIGRQEQALERTIDGTVIHCFVTSTQGTDRSVSVGTVNRLLGRDRERGFYQDEFVTNVRAKIRIALAEPENHSLVCILTPDSDPALTPLEGGSLSLFEGWDESVFMTDEAVCVVPEDYPHDGEYLALWTAEHPLELRVIGTHTGPKANIYCPFYTTGYYNGVTYSYQAEGCSFDIKDTRRLDEAKESLYELFVKPDIHNEPALITYGVRIEDAAFQSTVSQLRGNIRTLALLLPVLLLLGAAVGFFISYLSTRSRLREYAVMRLLGMKRGEVFRAALFEHLLIALAGGAVGFAAGVLVSGTLTLRMAAFCAGGMLAFLVGTAASVSRVTRINVMKLMKTEE